VNAPTKQRVRRPRDEALAQLGSALKGAMAVIGGYAAETPTATANSAPAP
jgi:hypothetical protein